MSTAEGANGWHLLLLYGEAYPGIQFPHVLNISLGDQGSFLEEYRNTLLGDLDKLEFERHEG